MSHYQVLEIARSTFSLLSMLKKCQSVKNYRNVPIIEQQQRITDTLCQKLSLKINTVR